MAYGYGGTAQSIKNWSYPSFRTEARSGNLTDAVIDVSPETSILAYQKENKEFGLYLFSFDKDGKVFALFDINLDGVWDVRQTPTKTPKYYINLEGTWVGVDHLEGLKSDVPAAAKDRTPYEFHGEWRPTMRNEVNVPE